MKNTSILNYNNENSLVSIIGKAYFTAKRNYIICRELPTGKGFADLAFIPRKGKDLSAIVIELKWDKSAKSAIEQIHTKEYPEKLKEFTHNMILVGINYNKETKEHICKIEKIN